MTGDAISALSAASIVPLYVGTWRTMSRPTVWQILVRSRYDGAGGIMATEYETGEQWDKPGGWAPRCNGWRSGASRRYGDDMLGDEIV